MGALQCYHMLFPFRYHISRSSYISNEYTISISTFLLTKLQLLTNLLWYLLIYIILWIQALIDGPICGVPRQAINLGQVVLTPLTFSLPRGARTSIVSKKWTAAGVSEKWAASAWAKKIAQRKRRAALSDFERFQVMVLRKQKRYTVKKALAKA